ncbi:hypothetical protein GW17_00027843 [Ensete ventricosum]|nr:hypothetical protein GW17_00027843 [Ensete ventricosum]RZR83399.1 hypothetical protein BHM03_00009999 [Ensete ventricosum]
MGLPFLLQSHIRVLESPENRAALLMGLEYLIGISYVDDTEVFKATLMPEMVDGLGSPLLQRRQLYSGPLSKLRTLMICRMAKPEEIMRETLIYLSHLDHEDTEQQVHSDLAFSLLIFYYE